MIGSNLISLRSVLIIKIIMPWQCVVAFRKWGKMNIKEDFNMKRMVFIFIVMTAVWPTFNFSSVLLPRNWQSSSYMYSGCNVRKIIWLRCYFYAKNWQAHFEAPDNTFHLKLKRRKKNPYILSHYLSFPLLPSLNLVSCILIAPFLTLTTFIACAYLSPAATLNCASIFPAKTREQPLKTCHTVSIY